MNSNELFQKMKNLGLRSPAVVEEQLREHGLYKFQVHDDLSVSLFDSVDYHNFKFQQLPYKLAFVQGRFSICKCNELVSLVGFPTITQGGVHIYKNEKLTSFHNIHNHIKQIDGVFDCGNATHLLGLCAIKGIDAIGHFNDTVATIMNDYRHDMLTCQQALIDAGFPQHAKL